jgi:hypothetical protein
VEEEGKKKIKQALHLTTFYSYRSLNAIIAQSKNCPFVLNTTIDVKHITSTSDNIGTLVSRNIRHEMTIVLLLSDLFVIFLSSIVVLTPNGQFLGCAIIVFSERYRVWSL